MKKYVIIGLVLAALAFGSCKLDTQQGGTIEVINNNDNNASIYIMKGSGIDSVTDPKTAESNGGRAVFLIDEDGTYTVNAIFYSGPNPPPIGTFTGHGDIKAVLSGGNTVTVRVKPSP